MNCDFICHGDDPCFELDGTDSYGPFKEAGCFKVFKRTEGVSTTDIVGRLLSLSKDNERLMSSVDAPMTTDMFIKKTSQDESQ